MCQGGREKEGCLCKNGRSRLFFDLGRARAGPNRSLIGGHLEASSGVFVVKALGVEVVSSPVGNGKYVLHSTSAAGPIGSSFLRFPPGNLFA